MEIGCCGTTETYLAVREMGYDYIELSGRQLMSLTDVDFGDFLALYRRTGFPCRGFNDYCGADTPLVGPGSGSEAGRRWAAELCHRGGALGVRTVGIGAPLARRLPEGYPPARAEAEMESFLRMLCPLAEEYGLTVLLEAVHSGMCNYLTETAEAAAMVRRLGLDNLAMVLDYYHAAVMGEDLHALAGYMPLVRHLHVSTDLAGHARGYLHQEHLPLLRELLGEAFRAGYTGSLSVEAAGDRLAAEGEDCCRWMRRAAQEAAAGKEKSSCKTEPQVL